MNCLSRHVENVTLSPITEMLQYACAVTQALQNKFDSKAGTTARAIETLMGQYFD